MLQVDPVLSREVIATLPGHYPGMTCHQVCTRALLELARLRNGWVYCEGKVRFEEAHTVDKRAFYCRFKPGDTMQHGWLQRGPVIVDPGWFKVRLSYDCRHTFSRSKVRKLLGQGKGLPFSKDL